ncbi:MAG TPA: ABC transporter ATP-binding protein [Alphaproteobacteria bacterium]|nr:ABC transporter ATP-binding protein [Alphaproteobacteria bacterium]
MDAQEIVPAGVVLEGIGKRFGVVQALDGVDLAVEPGELLTILGPSGSGKTTLLKIVAGFETPEQGRVRLAGADITLTPPAKRDVGMVFQNYALFPHLTVRENIAFPLEMRRRPRAEIKARVDAALELVDLAGFAARLPRQLSGGQQQRVALARAIVFKPRLLLLDEPFGALDRKLREAMQLEVRRLQRRLGITTLFITHDQEEALVLSDRIAVMNRGRIEQVAHPREIYERPANRFVADFVGESNLLFGTVSGRRDGLAEVILEAGPRVLVRGDEPRGARVGILVRPERFAPATEANRLEGEVIETVYVGASLKHRVRLDSGVELLVRLPAAAAARAGASIGARIGLGFAPEDAHLFPRGSAA